MTAGLCWAVYDASILAEAKVGFWEALSAAVYASGWTAAATLPIGLACAWLWYSSALGRAIRRGIAERPFRSAAAVLMSGLGVLLLSCFTFAAVAVFQRLFASESVRQIASAGSVPVVGLLLVLVGFGLRAPVARLFERALPTGRQAVALACAIIAVLFAGWCIAITNLAAEVFEQLAIHSYLPVLIVAVGSGVGGLASGYKYARRGAFALALAAVPLVVSYAVGEPSKQLRLALEYRDSGTGFIFKLLEGDERHAFAAARKNREQSAVCRPDAQPPSLAEVGKAPSGAANIIWLTVDALRWDHTSLSGYERDTTPNLARHASEAVVFERAHTPATSTRQTFQSLFSGVYPSMIEVPRAHKWGVALPEQQHTVAEFLSAAGYRTVAFSSEGKIFSGEFGALQGFDLADFSPVEQKVEKGYSAPYVVDRIVETLQESDAPQFVWTHLTEPHQPYKGGPDPIDYGSSEIDRYDAAIHFVDQEVGRLIDALQKLEADEPTYLFLTADHGQAFGEHGNRLHGSTVYQEETHVPLIVWGPELAAGRHETPVSLMDLFPTTLDLAGLEVPEAICGANLTPALAGREFSRGPVYMEQVPDRSRAYFAVGFIDGDYKTVVQPAADAVEVFNLAEDPGEKRDLTASDPRLAEEQRRRLRQFWRERGMSPSDYGLGGEANDTETKQPANP